jgi:hypothetical protein
MNDPSGTSAKSFTRSTPGSIKKYIRKPFVKPYDKIQTAWKNGQLAGGIKLDKTIGLVKVKLFINSSMIVLVQALILEHFLPYTRAIIVH